MGNYVENIIYHPNEVQLDGENLEYLLRSKLNFSTEDLKTYPLARACRLARRALIDMTYMCVGTYLKGMFNEEDELNKSRNSKSVQLQLSPDGKRKKMTFPWKKKSTI